MRRIPCAFLAFFVFALAAPAFAVDKERATGTGFVDRVVQAVVFLFEKGGGCIEPFGLSLCVIEPPPPPPCGGGPTASEPTGPSDDLVL